MFQYFVLWLPPFFPANILVSWETQEEAKCQRTAQLHVNPSEISFFFACWDSGLTRKKLLTMICRKLRQLFLWALFIEAFY